MKKKAKPAVKIPVKRAKASAPKRAAKPARGRQSAAQSTARMAVAEAQGALVGLAELVAISTDMRVLMIEIRDLLRAQVAQAEAKRQAEEQGGTLIIAESEGEDFE
jgi:hypothetical protein